ncbi:MAG: D-3-phosphoglycerate dehydrogenase (EC [uncultured Paraburkholderia sp.]|nr:MAG: D-3-phosphoglycerate dehydrogenase (EC [uncultured Paraburkholderia sp.]
MSIRILSVGVPDKYLTHLDKKRITVIRDPKHVGDGVDAMIYWFADRQYGHELIDPMGEQLRWVHVPWVGVEQLISERVRAGEVVLTNSRGATGVSVAEYVTGCVLSHAKSLPSHFTNQAARSLTFAPTKEVRGQTALILGLGDIGKHVARNLRHLGMRVRAVTRTASPHWACEEVLSIGHLAIELHSADYVVLCAPSTESTRHLINDATLSHFKAGHV